MKVLFVTPLYPSEKDSWYCVFIEYLARALYKKGCDITVLVPSRSSGKSRTTTVNRKDIKVVYLEYSFITNKKIGKIKEHIVLYKRIVKDINLEQFDLIHFHFDNNVIQRAFRKILAIYNIPYIVHIHGKINCNNLVPINIITKLKIEIINLMNHSKSSEKFFMNNANTVVSVSKKVKKTVDDKFSLIKNHILVYNGVDNKVFKPLNETNKFSGINISCVGNLIETKGQKYLISALKNIILQTEDDNIKLHIVGRGNMEDKLRNLTKELGIEKNVLFFGVQSQEQVAKIIRESQVFVLPSYVEGLGCVYLEAMASNVLAIGCSGQGIDEIIISGKNGYLVKEKDVDDLTKVLIECITHKEKRQKIAMQGYKTVVDDYLWENIGEKMLSIYNEILGGAVNEGNSFIRSWWKF
jgi:glycosyltransferase involved in cell wall biosynthesis